MKNIKLLNAQELVTETENAIRQERLCTATVIKLFEEIYVRRLYLERGFPSLFEMATAHFGYSASAAQRRINSMKLVHDLPDLENKIESGELSLSTAATLHSFFTAEKKEQKTYSASEKLRVVRSCMNKSARDVERTLVTLSPEREKRESLTYTSEERLRLSVSISEDLHKKINRLKDLWSHSNPDLSTEVLLEKVVEMALEKVDPVRINERLEGRRIVRESAMGRG